ncbi:MAG: SPOR domain-containing protein [Acidobacteria bacterium]|nr:SPOR domain-containing protein [Acidobacteriota bacterium]
MSGTEAVQSQDDQSHYEISLTAGQAFLAFVLLLLSLAASFAFGLIVGRGQGDERLIVRKEPSVVTEASVLPKKTDGGRIVELGVAENDFKAPDETATTAPATASAETTSVAPTVVEETTTAAPAPAPAAATPTPAPSAPPPAAQPAAVAVASTPAQPAYAQLLSTGDQKTAEALATKLIEHGFNNAYVERGSNDKGPLYKVRVKFASEPEARAAEAKLKEFAKDVWIVK